MIRLLAQARPARAGIQASGRGIAWGAAAALFTTVAAASVWSADFNLAIRMANQGKYELAYLEFKALADAGDPRGHNGIGVLYANGLGVERDDGSAVEWFRAGANRGFSTAQYYLGQMYQEGRGVDLDYDAAMSWYRRAAEQGDRDAQTNVGRLYARGLGVATDHAAAMRWYRRAAEVGDVRAQASIGDMYRTGDGVPRDYVSAYAWYGIAAAGGYGPAPELRDEVEQFLTPPELDRARVLARELYGKYSAQGASDAATAAR